MKSMKFLSVSMAVCMICLLTMTSCSAAEVPATSGGASMDNAKLTSETQPASTFSDVPAGAWYAEAINYCQQNGIMSGTSATTFAPEATLTRTMLATVLHRMPTLPIIPMAGPTGNKAPPPPAPRFPEAWRTWRTTM